MLRPSRATFCRLFFARFLLRGGLRQEVARREMQRRHKHDADAKWTPSRRPPIFLEFPKKVLGVADRFSAEFPEKRPYSPAGCSWSHSWYGVNAEGGSVEMHAMGT